MPPTSAVTRLTSMVSEVGMQDARDGTGGRYSRG